MTKVTFEEAPANPAEWIDHLAAGEQLIITRGRLPIAKLQLTESGTPSRHKSGSAKRRLTMIRSDDSDHLKDFSDSME